MKELKIAMIGAGSTYSPELIDGFITRQDRMRVREFALMDINMERLSIVGGLIRRMCGGFDHPPAVTMTDDLAKAVEGADYVVSQFRVGMLPARAKDEAIPLRYGYIGQETTGPGGFAKAIRTIPEILKIADAMGKHAPGARLINFTNPSGIITEAVLKYSGVPVVGLCNAPITMFKRFNEVMGWDENDVVYDYFGLNHLGFIRGMHHKGRDVTADCFARILDSDHYDYLLDYPMNKSYVRALGILPIGYLQYYLHQQELFEKLSAQEKTRGELLVEVDRQLLIDYGNPELKTKPPGLMQRGGAWYSEAAVALICSLENDDGRTHVVNLRNDGAITDLPHDAVVELPAVVRGGYIRAHHFGKLPAGIAGLVQHVKNYESLTVKAGAERSKADALVALMSHPFLRSANDAERMLDDIIAAHPQYIHLK